MAAAIVLDVCRTADQIVLHRRLNRYSKLTEYIEYRRPAAVESFAVKTVFTEQSSDRKYDHTPCQRAYIASS